MPDISKLWSQFKPRLKIKKRYAAFFTVVPLLFLLAFIKTPCPICNGTGYISTTGMGEVKVVRVEATLLSVGVAEGCVNFISYKYSVTLTLQNYGKLIDANGYVRLGLVDYKTSKLLATQYALVGVPANMELQTTFSTTFTVGLDAPTTTQVTAEIILNNALCQACNGTGKVALNNAPFLSTMKKTYTMEQIASVGPIMIPAPIVAVSDEWYGQANTTDQWALEHPDYVDQ